MRVFLARHGETEWNVEHRLQGRSDTRLTPRGEAHARALAGLLEDVPLAAVYSSTLRRALDTARPVAAAKALACLARPELVEIGYGVLEGHTPRDPDPEIQRLWAARKRDPLGFRVPGGESYQELRARLAPFVDEIGRRHPREPLLVVAHRATNRVLLGLLLGKSLEEILSFKHKHDWVLEIRPGHVPECIRHQYAPSAEPGGNP